MQISARATRRLVYLSLKNSKKVLISLNAQGRHFLRLWTVPSRYNREDAGARWVANRADAKAFEILAALVRLSGHLADKMNFMQTVWPDSSGDDGTTILELARPGSWASGLR